MNLNEYKISDEDFEDLGFKDIKIPNPKDFGLEEDLKELEGVSNFEGYPFFAMDIESDGTLVSSIVVRMTQKITIWIS